MMNSERKKKYKKKNKKKGRGGIYIFSKSGSGVMIS
jgi:hypothetical protein